MELRYSRELRGMIYFEVYGFSYAKYGRKRYAEFDGLVLSSFRPIKVLVPDPMDVSLRRERLVPKYVVLKTSSNERVVINENDVVINIYDTKELKRWTGKKTTIPYRVVARLYTTRHRWLVPWVQVPSYIVSTETLLLLATYWVRTRRGERLGVKMLWLRGLDDIERFVKEIQYEEGALILHKKVFVYVPKPSSVHYRDLHRALKKLEMEEEFGESEEEIFERYSEEEEEHSIPLF